MFHGINAELLYCVSRITSVFVDDLGQEIERVGTAFSLIIGERDALVTNAHLMDLNYGRMDSKYRQFQWHRSYLERIGKDDEGLPQKARKFLVPASHNRVLRHHNLDNDIAVINKPQVQNMDGSSNRQVDYCIPISDVATADELFRDLLPFDVVAFPGFPPWHSTDGPRAIMRGGTISSDPKFPYCSPGIENQDVILYEAFSFGGSSGSPVLAIPKVPPINVNFDVGNQFRRFLLVGVNAGHLNEGPGQHSGLSYFVKSSTIHDILGADANGC